jgi:CDP-diacylglycerol--glycerol-3-phosphate 3-phosphatidyltransferase/cardiolipin synthase
MQFTVPNLVSLSRLALAAAFIVVRSPVAEAAIVVVAAITDFADGWVARHFGQRSRAGEMLDPLTDKLFVATVLAVLLGRGQITIADVLLLLVRDLYNAIAFAVGYFSRWPIRFKARFSGKVVTVLQLITILAFLVHPEIAQTALWLTVLASLYAVFDYTRAAAQALRENAIKG